MLTPAQAKRLLPYLHPYKDGKQDECFVTAAMIRAATGLEPNCLLECPGYHSSTGIITEGGFGRLAHIIDKSTFVEYANQSTERARV